MARDMFTDSVGMMDSNGFYKPLSNVEVSVFLPGTTTPATIYQARTGTSQKTNPFTTTSGGMVEFWAEVGDYDVKFHDINIPARIADKTFGWNAINAAAGAIPSNRLAADAGVPYAALDAVTQRQVLPIGAVISWWRPSNAIAVPSGYAICDGSAVTAGNHDFAGGGTINLPDLRNAFVLGANVSNSDGASATSATDGAAAAPGIRGTGGTHGKNFQHSHIVASHSHSITHTHTIPNHSHSVLVGGTTGNNSATATNLGSGGPTFAANSPHTHSGSYGGLTATDGGGGATSGVSIANSGTATPGTDSQLSATTDMRPVYVGLLQIMKIKRN